ncbi:MAG: nucleotidyltransferase family protein [Myxococcaceae bacterium]
MGLCAVIFASGSGTRMGSDKLLLEVDGVPMLARAVAPYLACAALSEVLVVVRPGFRLPGLPDEARVIENPAHAEGMASSMRAGLAAAREGSEGIVLGLGDLPFLKPATVSRAIEAWRAAGGELLVSMHQGRRGHPVVLGARYRDELLATRGDVGAREVLRAHPGRVTLWESGDTGIADDVDTPGDLPGQRP